MPRELSRNQIAERSIIKKYRKEIWNPFVAAVKRYNLIQENDKIAVCISGGKDSMLMAKLFCQLKRVTDVPFEVVYLVMDPGYNKENRKRIIENARLLEVPVTIFETDIFDVADSVEKSPCYLCARMRRGHLYAKAKSLGCNKIALGHHLNDVIETTLMGMMYGSQIQGMLPRIKSSNFEGMELIRPMFCIKEESVVAWARYNKLEFIACACKFTENAQKAEFEQLSKRKETKALIASLKKVNPDIEHNLFKSLHNVSLDTLIEYKANGERHSFLEKFEDKSNNVL